VAAIKRLELRLVTGDRTDAGTDGDVFLGVGGREYNVDSRGDVNDHERNADRRYVFGENSTVLNPSENDPRTPWQTETEDLFATPMYIRIEPGDGGDWNIELAQLTVVDDSNNSITFDRLRGSSNLWLGERRGKYLYFRTPRHATGPGGVPGPLNG